VFTVPHVASIFVCFLLIFFLSLPVYCGPGSSGGIATDYRLDGSGIESRWREIFRYPDWLCAPPSLLYNGYRVFPGGKVQFGRAFDHSPPSNAAVKKG
jgi:hypothetical protein